ncbi:hypothetical protein [Methylobacterium nigriterrae]|uniref:hypothetical protein n=1 Tax=Methylobacterium nigriterrae TaxID=3127512 RepID=UPI003D675F61
MIRFNVTFLSWVGADGVGAGQRDAIGAGAPALTRVNDRAALGATETLQISLRCEERSEVLEPASQPDLEALLRSFLARCMAPGFFGERAPPRPEMMGTIILDCTDFDGADAADEATKGHVGNAILCPNDGAMRHLGQTGDEGAGSTEQRGCSVAPAHMRRAAT